MGPMPKKEKFETTVFNRIQNTVKVATAEYFVKPLYYLFYGTLAVVILALTSGADLPWQLYALLGILAGVEVYQHFKMKK